MITMSDINTIVNGALFLVIKMSLPVLLTSMIIGLVISIFQTVTSIQEQTLTFVPKLIVTLLMVVLTGGWIMNTIAEFATRLFQSFGRFIGGA